MLNLNRVVFMLALAFPLSAWAQHGRPGHPEVDADREDRMQSLRIAYFVEELELNASESSVFWPVWTEHQDALRAHGDALRAVEDGLAKSTSDETSQALLAELKSLQLQGIELRHASMEALAEIIGYQRAATIPQVERAFRSQLMKRRMDARGPSQSGEDRRPGGPPRH